MGWIRWVNHTPCGLSQVGQMPAENVDFHIRKFGKEAKKLLAETGADHVLYAIKKYSKDGLFEEVTFYQRPMTDKEFDELVAIIPNVTVYALHAQK